MKTRLWETSEAPLPLTLPQNSQQPGAERRQGISLGEYPLTLYNSTLAEVIILT